MDFEFITEKFNFDDDTVSVGEVINAKNEALKEYIEFCKNLDDSAEEFNIDSHIEFLKTIKNINDNLVHTHESDELISENYGEDFIREHIENEFPEIYEYADGGYGSYNWPGTYVEFDIDSAIQDKISESSEVKLGDTTFYVIEL